MTLTVIPEHVEKSVSMFYPKKFDLEGARVRATVLAALNADRSAESERVKSLVEVLKLSREMLAELHERMNMADALSVNDDARFASLLTDSDTALSAYEKGEKS